MFAITITPEWTGADQDRVDHLMYGGSMEELRDRELAHRSRVPICHFRECECGHEIECPVCGSGLVEDDAINDYGGTMSGWTRCLFCGYSTSWADLSAVI